MKSRIVFGLLLTAVFILIIPSISSAAPILNVNASNDFIVSVSASSNPYMGLSVSGNVTSAVLGPGYKELPPVSIMVTDVFDPTKFNGDVVSRIIGDQPYLAWISYDTYWGYSPFAQTYRIGENYYQNDMNIFYDTTDYINPGSTYYLTQVVTLTQRMQDQQGGPTPIVTQFNADLGNPIPEPSSLILLGSGLIGAVVFFRKRG